MATPQIRIDEALGSISVFNLALNVAGIINNKKNVALYIIDDKTGAKQEILTGSSGVIGKIRDVTTIIGSNSIIMDAEVNEESKLTEQPLETGAVTSDYKIKMPTTITVTMVLPAYDYQDILAELKKYKDDAQMIYIETKYGSFKNMQIVGIPCNMNVENISRITFAIKFKEVLGADKDKKRLAAGLSDYTTVNTGNKLGLELPFFNMGALA